MGFSWKAIAGLLLVSTMAAGHAQTASQDAGTTESRPQSTDASSIEAQIENLRQTMDSQRAEIDRLQRQLQESNSKALQTQQVKLTTEIEHPDAIHYKGVTLSPQGSFIEAATVYRSAATGGGINTPFTGIPLENSDQAQMSEFFGSGRQSRLALKATGKLANMKLTGYYEMDWLGTGITSNNNQSNSYVMRQRQIWAQAALRDGWSFTGGQMWSLATETTQGLENGTEVLPGTIDPQYTAGFVWARQYGFRVTKDFGNKFWIGASAENAQTLPGGSNPANQTLGQSGAGGGLYNSTANYSYNLAPDMIAKIAWEPGWGHYELFGIARFFRNRVYPNAPSSSAGAYNDTTVGGGIGGGFRVPLAAKHIILGLKGLYGDGTGRYGDSTIGDITFKPDGQISPLHTFSALGTLEFNPNKRLNIYTNYGGDYVGRDIHGNAGYGLYTANMSGCKTEAVPNGSYNPGSTGTCAGNNKDVQEGTVGYWFNFYSGSKGKLRQGIQYSRFTRNLWSGTGTATNPGGGAQGTDNIFETSFRYYLP
ncbi:MAG: hypothetical protein ACRD3F_16755 [Acidobacteriaceae bacterium]